MLCVIDYTAYRVSEHYSLPDWLNLRGISYYRLAPGHPMPERVSKIIISGGPHHSNECEDTVRIVQQYQVPILGICLGCMCVVRAFGGELRDSSQATSPMLALKSGREWLLGFPNKSQVTVAHREKITSLGAGGLESDIVNSAGEIIGVSVAARPVFGVMFHPESPEFDFSAEVIINNFLKL